MICSDIMSGASIKDKKFELSDQDVNSQVHSIISNMHVTDENLKQFNVKPVKTENFNIHASISLTVGQKIETN